MDVNEKKFLRMAEELIVEAGDTEIYAYERELKLKVARDIVAALLEDEDGNKVD